MGWSQEEFLLLDQFGTREEALVDRGSENIEELRYSSKR